MSVVQYESIPIDGVTAVNTSLSAVKLDRGKLFADFSIDDRPLAVRVTIADVVVHRLIDGIELPKEELEPHSGLSRDHLAYSLTGSRFFEIFSPMINGHSAHYRFITGTSCLDVISKARPLIRTIGIAT
ncbi:hypothetical protein AB3480_00385 [Rhizobium mongolense]|uniref:hypothetical protein n=1 Tax=Rhizobium mongolense TaxID=57676 RepID=UPI0034A1BE99